SSTAVKVLVEMFATGSGAREIVAGRGWSQISDEAALAEIIAAIIQENVAEVTAYREGNEKVKGWFVGQVMRATRGQANPALVNRLLSEQLAE
ncbi:MAG: Asp-tRNA(Asn)/Glu-tRNA(Gln) amidotransferase GatCAB subunit B, partial [Candidatus Promineifilaceae bacterium]